MQPHNEYQPHHFRGLPGTSAGGCSGTWKISVNGGTSPVWSPDGRKLYFVRGRRMHEVTLQFEPEFSASPPKTVLQDLRGKGIMATTGNHLGATWDIAPDGERMLMIRGTEPAPPRQINVLINWFEELKERVPTGGG